MITSINHITLAVSDIKRSFEFYHNILGLKPICSWDKGAYFLAGEFWFCLNVDSNVQADPSYTHCAFSVNQKDFPILSRCIIDSGAKIFKENNSEGDSLYFLDPDGHKLEIHIGDLQSRINEKKLEPGLWKNIRWFV